MKYILQQYRCRNFLQQQGESTTTMKVPNILQDGCLELFYIILLNINLPCFKGSFQGCVPAGRSDAEISTIALTETATLTATSY